MEGIDILVSVIIVIFGILQIVLFFKIWGMTNNIFEIKELIKKYSYEEKVSQKQQKTTTKTDIQIEDLVIELKSKRQLIVVDITEDGRFQCKTPEGIAPIGFFERNEIELVKKER
jgi:hypothetical protein